MGAGADHADRISGKIPKEQNAQITGLTQFLEKANQKVEEIAVKALNQSVCQKRS